MKRRTAIVKVIMICVLGQAGPTAALSSPAADARALVRSALEAMGREDRIRSIKSLQLEGLSHQNLLEQSERPEGPWIIDYSDFTEYRDLENRQLRRLSKTRGVVSPEARALTTIVSGGVAAYESNGRLFLAPASEVQDADETLLLSPDRVLVTALDSGDLRLESDAIVQGVNNHILAFTQNGKPYRLFLNANTALPTAVELTADYPHNMFWSVWGDTATRVYYSTWMLEPGGILYPRQFDVMRLGMPYQSITITRLTINPVLTAGQFNIPAETREAFAKNKVAIDYLPLGWRARGTPQELAKEVVMIPAGWNVTLVRQSDGVVIIEAPISPGYSARVIDEVERRFPGVPVKAVISTSDAWPHIGGIREYVRRGITIYALDLNRPILERVIAGSHQNHPDTLAKSPRKPKFQIVSGKTTLGEGANRLDLYPIRGESSERMIMVYFPQHGIVYGSDLIQKIPTGYFMPVYLAELADAVRREKLKVVTAFAMHSGPSSWQEILDAITRAAAPTSESR